jgi:menaquinone-9 beta-reductase
MVNMWDVAIAGGGPAGLASAIAARRKGLNVAVFEGVAGCIDKCCGEGLMPDALAALRELGMILPPSAGASMGGVRFLDGDVVAEARFPQQNGIGVRRTVLHSLLEDHARQAGVEIFRGKPFRLSECIRARWIVAADGSQSTLRRAAGLDGSGRYTRRFGTRQHFQIKPWTDLVEVHWANGAQAYATPVAGEVGVAIISSDPRKSFAELLPLFPALAMRLRGAVATSSVRGAVTFSRRFSRVTNANVALVGDASGSVDAVTGLGLSLAFQQAVALGEALAEGHLSSYASAHKRILRMPRLMEMLMLAMDRHEWFRRRAIRALAADPEQFSGLLATHVQNVPLALGWKFFTV